jgi:hypothetical protein
VRGIAYLLAAVLIAGLGVLPQPGYALHELNLAGKCNTYGRFTSCNKDASIVIVGQDLRHGTGFDAGKTTVSVAEPVGALRLVGCGIDAATQRAAIGDTNAVFDAKSECASTAGCDQTAQDAGRPYRNFVRVMKQTDGSWSLTGAVCQQVAVAGPPRVTPLMVWEQARRLISAAPIGLAPRESTLVNIQTIMWVNTGAARMLPSVVLVGQPVSIHIAIDHVVWAFGDGRTDTAEGPGKPYDPQGDPCPTKQCPGYFGHAYTTTGQMTITATVTWRATFRVGGGAFTPIPGTIAGPSATARILVREARSLLVPDPTPS